MGIFKKRQEPQTFEEYVAYFDALPAERRNRYLKYFECFDTMKSTLFTNYENMTDFYDYEGYRLDCIAKKIESTKRRRTHHLFFPWKISSLSLRSICKTRTC